MYSRCFSVPVAPPQAHLDVTGPWSRVLAFYVCRFHGVCYAAIDEIYCYGRAGGSWVRSFVSSGYRELILIAPIGIMHGIMHGIMPDIMPNIMRGRS